MPAIVWIYRRALDARVPPRGALAADFVAGIEAAASPPLLCSKWPREKTRRTSQGDTKAKLPISIANPNVTMPRQMAMPMCSGMASRITTGRDSLGQTRNM